MSTGLITPAGRSNAIAVEAGITQVVKVRLLPSRAQEELLRQYCGTARAAYNSLLWRVKGVINQREAERSYGIPEEELTPSMSWHKYSLEKHLREYRDEWIPWHDVVPSLILDRQAHQLAAGLASWKAHRTKFPRYRKKRGPSAGLIPVTFKATGATWLTDGGRTLKLPLAAGVRKSLGAEQAKALSSVLVVKDNRGRRAAKLIRDGRGQVQEVTYSYSGGYWWAAIRMRVLPAARTQPTRHQLVGQPRKAIGLDAGMGKHFVTLNAPLEGITDQDGHVSAPKFLTQTLKGLAQAQRALQRTTPGSNRYHKALRRVQKLHGRAAAQRKNWSQHLAITLTENADTLVIEDLNLRGMARRKGKKGYRFGKTISDNGWGQFVLLLKDQANKREATVMVASRWYPSSKTCSNCGAAKTKLSLKTRRYDCFSCGLSLDRDVNAARNLAKLAATPEVVLDGVTDAGEASSTKSCNVGEHVSTSVDAAALEALLESFEATRPLTLA